MAKSKNAFCSWSGGKESALSLYSAQRKGVDTRCLVNMTSESGKHSRTHGVPASHIKAQAHALGLPVMQRKTSWQNYEKEFKKTISGLKRKKIENGVFGDIDLAGHREWVERVCKELNVKPILPLWKKEREALLDEFIRLGFKAVIVTVKSDLLNKKFLGRTITANLVKSLKAIKGIDISGENGEYHTFVFDGPIFKKPIKYNVRKKYFRNGYWFLKIDIKKDNAII